MSFATPDKLALANPPQRAFKLRIETELDPAGNTKLMGLYRSGSAYCTQCEAEGFRRITYFLDRPDVLSTYLTRLEADKSEAPILLANGNLETRGDLPGTNRHFAVWRDPHKKPSYLFALVAGDLAHLADRFVTASGHVVELGIYVEHGRQDRAAYAMDSLKRAMHWDEEAYGREYDLDVFNIVAVSDFNMGAMENKGLNVFNDKYVLALPETATDEDYAGIEAVIAHEYFHNWTGNRITCRDWFQLCLKEGLTVFRDQDFSAHERSAPVKRIADVRGLRAAQFPEDAGPLAHNVRPETYHEINNFYTATVYQKGAELIRMLKLLIGAPAFRAGMDLYFERCDGTAATVEDFLGCFAQASGRDLTEFQRWYNQAGTPLLTFRSAYDEAARSLTLDISQATAPTREQAVKLPLTMPIALGLIDASGAEIALASSDAPAPTNWPSGVFELDRRVAARDLHRRREPPEPFPDARLLGAGARRRRPDRGRSLDPFAPRSRQFQSLAGDAEPGDAAAASLRRGDTGGAGAKDRRRFCRGLWRDPRGGSGGASRCGFRGPGPEPAERRRHRARDGAQCRPRCDFRGARRPARRARPRPCAWVGAAS